MSYQTKKRANYLSSTQKLKFFKARQREGDKNRLVEETGYTTRFINYVLKGERNVNDFLANIMYNISRRRMKNSELTNA